MLSQHCSQSYRLLTRVAVIMVLYSHTHLKFVQQALGKHIQKSAAVMAMKVLMIIML
jgi:hypothetical protein